jgi:LPPG:FO 2-phospho-L-lactate transferase
MRKYTNVVALSGGVGGARLVDGLAAVLPPGALTVIVNTGDDFVHWGLSISPDTDTVMYTLAGLAHPQQGWGLAGESFHALAMVERFGGEAWFRLGDRDLATHVLRSDALARGKSLTEVTAALCGALGVRSQVLPMSDLPRPTLIDTPEGTLSFQDWLVRRQGRPKVRAVRFGGRPAPAPGVIEAIAAAELVVIGPSNPYVSIDPILALDGVREALGRRSVVAVSPIVDGRAVKGPLAEMIVELARRPATAAAVADHYGDLLSGIVIERGDAPPARLRVLETATVMGDRADRARLAREVLTWAAS